MINKIKVKSKILLIVIIVICVFSIILFLLVNTKAEGKQVVIEDKIVSEAQTTSEAQVLAYVNDSPIYASQIDEALKINENADKNELLYYRIREELVFQEKENRGVNVEDTTINESISELQEHYPDLYDVAIKQYGNPQNYKQALYYRYLYDGVKMNVILDYFYKHYMTKENLISEMKNKNITYTDENLESSIYAYIKEFYSNESRRIFKDWLDNKERNSEIIYCKDTEYANISEGYEDIYRAYYLVFKNLYEMDVSLNDNIQCIAFDYKNIDFKTKNTLQKELQKFCNDNKLVYMASTIDELKANGYIIDGYFEDGILIKLEKYEEGNDGAKIYGKKFRSGKGSVSGVFNLRKDKEWELVDISNKNMN